MTHRGSHRSSSPSFRGGDPMTLCLCSDEQVTRARFRFLLDDFFDRGIARAAAFGPDVERLWQLAARTVSGGKLVRPNLLIGVFDALISDRSCAPHRDPERASEVVAHLAVGIELLHYAFLLHDDVLDGDLLRRGHPNLIGAVLDDDDTSAPDAARSMHWAQTCGILMGDLLLSATHQIFARAELPAAQRGHLFDLLDLTILDSVAGELVDVGLSDAVIAPELSTILDMTTRKTATYTFELPMRMAAVLADAPPVLERRLGDIGRHLGLGFQLQDDLICAFGDPASHGKDRYSDLREGKQTAIIAAARQTKAWPRVETLLAKAAFSRDAAAELSELLRDCGAQDRVADLAEQEFRSAVALINTSGGELPPAARAVLLDLVASLRGRRS